MNGLPLIHFISIEWFSLDYQENPVDDSANYAPVAEGHRLVQFPTKESIISKSIDKLKETSTVSISCQLDKQYEKMNVEVEMRNTTALQTSLMQDNVKSNLFWKARSI